jgi:hypothetical protein
MIATTPSVAAAAMPPIAVGLSVSLCAAMERVVTPIGPRFIVSVVKEVFESVCCGLVDL